MIQNLGVTAVLHNLSDNVASLEGYEATVAFDPFDWTTYTLPGDSNKHSEVAATPALARHFSNFLSKQGLIGRGLYSVYDIHSSNKILSQEFQTTTLSGSTDAIVAPYGLAQQTTLMQARLIVDWKTPEAMVNLRAQLSYDLANWEKLPGQSSKSGQPLAE